MSKKAPWKKLSSKIVYKNPWFSVRKDKVIRPDGKKGTYSIVKMNTNSVFIVPVSADGKIFLQKQHRYTTGVYSWEIPGGRIKKGEKPSKAAKRELKEELDLTPKSLQKIGEVQVLNGTSDGLGNVFVCVTKEKNTKNIDAENEGIGEVGKFSLNKVKKMVKEGKISDSQSIASLYLYALNKNG